MGLFDVPTLMLTKVKLSRSRGFQYRLTGS